MNAIQVCQLFIDTIASVENRCMAADGPVTPTCTEITDAELRAVYEAARAALAAPSIPIDIVLFCPCCGVQHIDEPEYSDEGPGGCGPVIWGNPPHRSHLCAMCGHQWRPADVPTNGVKAVKTKGAKDSPLLACTRIVHVAAKVAPSGITVLQQRVADLVTQHGSYRKAGKAVRVSGYYLCRLFKGTYTNPSARVCKQLGLRRVVTFERVVE